MKLKEIIELSKLEVSGGGQLNLYTPDTSIYSFARKGFNEVVSFFPLTKVVTIKSSATEFVDIPSEEEVDQVLEVVFLESNDRGFNFDAQELFFASSSFIQFGDDLENWIMYQRNLRAYKVLVGADFRWEQSKQNPHRIYLDNVPNSVLGFTVKFTIDEDLPATEPADDSENNVEIPEPQATYLNRYLTAKIKLTEGAILGRFKPTGQAAQTDGRELKQEGKQELQEVQREMKDRGFSLLSL